MTEEKKKLNRIILSANKNNYNGGRGKGNKKVIQKNLQNKSKNIFLESQLSESFPVLAVTAHLTSLGCLPMRADLWTCCGGSSDSNLVLLLCVLASNVDSDQN